MSEQSRSILQVLRRVAASDLHMDPAAVERIERDMRLSELGLDSLGAAAFVVEIEVAFGITLPPLLLFEAKTVGDVIDRIIALAPDKSA